VTPKLCNFAAVLQLGWTLMIPAVEWLWQLAGCSFL
jgi:hypothetical protein